MQHRLRNRRQLLWSAVEHAAAQGECDCSEVVEQLQTLQDSLSLGITRIEAFAQEAKKNVGKCILKVAEEYAAKKAGQSTG